MEGLEKENNELKTRLLDTERDLSEITSNYERDKALWEDKFDFLENQKQQAKRDLQDAHKKFEMTVDQLRRKDSSDRGKSESAQMLLINSLEKKYKDQIKSMTDSHNQIIQELTLKYKQLDKDYKEISEKYEIENRGKMSEYGNLEKKVRELLQKEHELQNEIKVLKNDRDKKSFEYQDAIENEKQIYKNRIQELENKAKNVESQRSNMLFEFEKERAMWSLEKDKLVTDIENITENLKKAKRKRDALMKENERLKNDNRNRRLGHASTMKPTILNGVLAGRQATQSTTEEASPLTESGYNSANRFQLKSPKLAQKYIGDYSTMKSHRSAKKNGF